MCNRLKPFVLAAFGLFSVALSCGLSWANNVAQSDEFDSHPEKGWYFYQSKPHKKAIILPVRANTKQGPKQKQSIKIAKHSCKNYLTWRLSCGFVYPTGVGLSSNQSYQFEQKEYKDLIHNYALRPNSQNAVYQFQRFNMWVLNQAMTASYTWQNNLAQHPDVNANVQVPVSQFGIRVIKNIESHSEAVFWKTLSETAFFVLVTRTNNKECQAQGTIMRMLEHQTGVTVWNFSVDKDHLPGFKHYMNYPSLSPREQKAIASHLKINWLPAVYLYLKPLQKGQVGRWIRVSSGITPMDQISSRTINFVEAYRHAIIQGVGKNKHIVPNFRVNHLYELADQSEGLSQTQNMQVKAKENGS